MTKPTTTVTWKHEPDAHDYPAAADDNAHVADDLSKVHEGQALSPVLVIQGDMVKGIPAQIADGYHRICASYHVDENTEIPCRIVEWDA